MKAIVLYLHIHQPWRVRRGYSAFDTGVDHNYFYEHSSYLSADNEAVLKKVAHKSYLPTSKILLELLKKYPQFKLSLSITGTVIEQCEIWAPELLDVLRELVKTGRVEIVGETYYHSLSFFFSRDEFERQVKMHSDKIFQIFGVRPTAFRGTELSYNDELGAWADAHKYKAILAEGWDGVLGWRSPNFLYQPPGAKHTKLLLKNYKLSDDFAFRFSNKSWKEYPLTMGKFGRWLDAADGQPLRNLFVDFETFGEHQWADTGIFEFLKEMPKEWLKDPEHTFMTVSEAATTFAPAAEISMPRTVTWADTERDLTAWLGNRMQQEAARYTYELEKPVLASGDLDLISDWRRLTTSDHTYYMCTKWMSDGDVHSYFSPYDSPYDAFLYFMNALRDVRCRLLQIQDQKVKTAARLAES
ncbi:MAG: glycoside hydrolase family 57 protein [Candidatus Nomurabacteria bacterium]|nr:glycoside hydrolase family 57 protein [Candidatus Nomurabacteria bacterium]